MGIGLLPVQGNTRGSYDNQNAYNNSRTSRLMPFFRALSMMTLERCIWEGRVTIPTSPLYEPAATLSDQWQ